jgi:mannan endo-1,4-beta-mannosidase
MPIMIDAPDCGTSLSAFLAIGQELITHDPRHSILLSVHAYWAGDYDGTADVALAVNAGLPIVFGEIANKQEDNGNQCHYALDGTGLDNPPPSGFQYQNLLAQLKQVQVGWLAWAWYKDACAARCITPDGNYGGAGSAGLTPYGNDILNNASYGLLAVPPKRTASLPGAAPFP